MKPESKTIRSLHSLFTELGREPGSAVQNHWWIEIYPAGMVIIRHHLNKWKVIINNSKNFEIHDPKGFLCFVTPSNFIFHQSRIFPNVIAKLKLPGGFMCEASEIYRRIVTILKSS